MVLVGTSGDPEVGPDRGYDRRVPRYGRNRDGRDGRGVLCCRRPRTNCTTSRSGRGTGRRRRGRVRKLRRTTSCTPKTQYTRPQEGRTGTPLFSVPKLPGHGPVREWGGRKTSSNTPSTPPSPLPSSRTPSPTLNSYRPCRTSSGRYTSGRARGSTSSRSSGSTQDGCGTRGPG